MTHQSISDERKKKRSLKKHMYTESSFPIDAQAKAASNSIRLFFSVIVCWASSSVCCFLCRKKKSKIKNKLNPSMPEIQCVLIWCITIVWGSYWVSVITLRKNLVGKDQKYIEVPIFSVSTRPSSTTDCSTSFTDWVTAEQRENSR